MTQSEATALFTRYGEAFDAFNAQAIVTFFDVPCLITNTSQSGALTSEDQLVRNFEAVNESHRGIGYAHAAMLSCEVVRSVLDSFAEVDVVWRFQRRDESEICRFAMSYLLRNVSGNWKICCAFNAEG